MRTFYAYSVDPFSGLHNDAILYHDKRELVEVANRLGVSVVGVYLDKCVFSCQLPLHVKRIHAIDAIYQRKNEKEFEKI